MPSFPSRQCFRVSHPASVGQARRAASQTCASLGFSPEESEQIGLVVTELATNLIKHAQGGTLTLTPLSTGDRIGVEIESCDNGPGIADIQSAIADRFSTTGTLGTGLGAVNRLMDELEVESPAGQGTRVVCRKWLRQHRLSPRHCPLDIGVATRPFRSGQANGDAFVIKHWEESALVGVIDGLGHGHFAHLAARAARNFVEGHYDLGLEQIFQGVDRACHATRGVVMALARFDWGQDKLLFASVGNIEAKIFPSPGEFSFRTLRGVIGFNAPKPVVTEHCWSLDHALVMHSDGLESRWGQEACSGLAHRSASELASDLLNNLSKEHDDATVLVVKGATL
jgi:anti-sigma regulatory factor (Ser/Thr protein kinase)/serine/threonine protein phosphatase PrpC